MKCKYYARNKNIQLCKNKDNCEYKKPFRKIDILDYDVYGYCETLGGYK